MLKARITVTLKQEVSDPQGHAVQESLETLHPGLVSRVRVGKYLEVDLCETDPTRAHAELDKVCHELLSNPVIEDYSFDIVEVQS